jgi:hypothetical protein
MLVQLVNRRSINEIKDDFWMSIKSLLRDPVISRTIRVNSLTSSCLTISSTTAQIELDVITASHERREAAGGPGRAASGDEFRVNATLL